MPFIKGQSKIGGRSKGCKNKTNNLLESVINHLTESGFNKFNEELNKLNGKEYLDTMIKLIKISNPQKADSKIKAQEYLVELINNKTKKL